MKRYKIKVAIDAGYQRTFLDVEISPDGEWYRREDVEEVTNDKAEIRKLRHAVNGLMQTLRIAATSQGVNLELESVECNCEEMVERATGRAAKPFVWMCLAHGYKRL